MHNPLFANQPEADAALMARAINSETVNEYASWLDKMAVSYEIRVDTQEPVSLLIKSGVTYELARDWAKRKAGGIKRRSSFTGDRPTD
jgi:hypothetical protein